MEAIVWSKENCAFCEQAKTLLKAKNVTFEERVIGSSNWTKEDLLREVPNARTVPQIFLNGELVGGLDGLRKKLV